MFKLWVCQQKLALRALLVGSLVFGSCGSAMAGNVQVLLEGSLLKVIGDNTANTIAMVQTAVGDVVVQGGTGTTVNGRASAVLRRVAINAMDVRMAGGNDVVTMRGFSIANDLFVNLGSGNDRFATSGPNLIQVNVAIEGEAGTDVVQLTNATIGEDLAIDGGIGVLNVSLNGIDCGKNLSIIGDESNDVVSVLDAMVGDYVAIETKGGSDRVTVNSVTAFGLAINTDLGADVVAVSQFVSQETIGIFTGTGADSVVLTDVATTTNLTVSVDSDNDRVRGENVIVGGDAVFEGGNGVDTLTDLGIEGASKKEIKEFEVLLP